VSLNSGGQRQDGSSGLHFEGSVVWSCVGRC
jgi:hypothetical protein